MNVIETPYKATLASKWTLFGTWLILAGFALASHGFAIAIQGLMQFLTGDIPSLKATHYGYEWLLPTVIGALVIAVPLLLAVTWVAEKIHGKATSNSLGWHSMGVHKEPGATGLLLRDTMKRDVIDELWGRGFLLGILTIPLGALIGQTIAFYLLFAVNAVLQLIQYRYAYRDEAERRQLGGLLPQFLGLVILATIFVQFGLLASVLVHILYNLLLASLKRLTSWRKQEAWRVLTGGGLLTIVSLALLAISSADIWHLEFHGLGEYIWGVLFFSGLLMVILELLLYDPEPKEAYSLPHRVPVGPSAAEAIFKDRYMVKRTAMQLDTGKVFADEMRNAVMSTLVTCAWIGIGYAIVHFFPSVQPYWMMIVATPVVLFYVAGGGSVSVNGTARLVWENAPVLLLIVHAFAVLGFWQGALIMLIRELVCRLIRRSIRYTGTWQPIPAS